jgi:hypothetical protein
MHHQVGQWAQQPQLNTFLDLLLGWDLRVYLTADHGAELISLYALPGQHLSFLA